MTFLQWYAFVILPLIVLAMGLGAARLHVRYLDRLEKQDR